MSSSSTRLNKQPFSAPADGLTDTLSQLSPRPTSSTRNNQTRERRNPSVTPRKFKRFFTPRTRTSLPASAARRALRELSVPSLNANDIPSSLPPFRDVKDQENQPFPRGLKRRKVLHSEVSPETGKTKDTGCMPLEDLKPRDPSWEHPQSSPCARVLRTVEDSDQEYEVMQETPAIRGPVKPIKCMRGRGLSAQLLSMTLDGSFRSGRRQVVPVNDYQAETSTFSTRPLDVHRVSSMLRPNSSCIPFCVTACNTNSLVALGDEEGRVRLVESERGSIPEFSKYHLAIRVHMNAVIDMAFSEDDRRLATASGDQTARVVDMPTQQTTSILATHGASLKQVRFQPGANNASVLATSGRDGVIQIWDLRCKGERDPQITLLTSPVEDGVRVRQPSYNVAYGRPVNSIFDAHRPWDRSAPLQSQNKTSSSLREASETRSGAVSVTAMQFLPPGQEHLLLTACEADSSIRLWDIRFLYNKNRGSPTPISITRPPDTHNRWRHFGINSINLSTDGSRFYTLCKDNTIYAYSTAHLIAGKAPELAKSTTNRPGPQRNIQEGLGPMYGFRHAKFHANTFYVKSALRLAKDGNSEMLAVGSSDHCAVLFPTDERYLPKDQSIESTSSLSGHRNSENFGPPLPMVRPALRRTGSGIGTSGRVTDSIPISTNGTPLIRGHDAEVNALTWTSQGNLITVGDDFIVRRWQEGTFARQYRQGGESGGRRWLSGWADVDEEYDEDDCVEVSNVIA